MNDKRKVLWIMCIVCNKKTFYRGCVEAVQLFVGISMERLGCDLSNYRVRLRKIVTE